MARNLLAAFAAAAAFALAWPASASEDRNSSQGRSAMKVSPRLAAILASGDGRTRETAFKVDSIREEYEVMGHFGLRLESQSLVVHDKPYDLLQTVKVSTGETVELWFDISSFFGKGF